MCDSCLGLAEGRPSRRAFIAGAAAVLVSATTSRAAGEPLQVICKEAWGAKEANGQFRKHTIRRITVHHSGVVLEDNREAPATLRGAQAYHQSQGWPDIAYHFMLDLHGNIYKGRPTWARGDTFTDYSTKGHLLVMCEGNYSEQNAPRAEVRALCDLLAWACGKFDVSPKDIAGHRDFAQTACPGDDLYELLQDGSIRRKVKARLARGGVEAVKLCGKKGKRRVQRIEAGTD